MDRREILHFCKISSVALFVVSLNRPAAAACKPKSPWPPRPLADNGLPSRDALERPAIIELPPSRLNFWRAAANAWAWARLWAPPPPWIVPMPGRGVYFDLFRSETGGGACFTSMISKSSSELYAIAFWLPVFFRLALLFNRLVPCPPLPVRITSVKKIKINKFVVKQ